jgi:hypothetical protein
MAELLFIRPMDDSAASLSAAIGARIIRHIQSHLPDWNFFSVNDLSGSANASRASVDAALEQDHKHLFYFGHGTVSSLVANGEALIDETNLRALPDSAVVVAVACRSAAGLGAASRGVVRAYLGWIDALPIPHLHPQPMLAALFDGLATLFQGATVDICEQKLKREFAEAYRAYRDWEPPASVGEGGKLYATMAPAFAEYCLRVMGDRSAVL